MMLMEKMEIREERTPFLVHNQSSSSVNKV